jgi:hypothetical protein
MSNYTNSTEKQLRKQKKKMREITELKLKSRNQLNGEQKAKLATEGDVKRRINWMEKIIENRKTRQPPTQTLTKLSVPKNKKKSNVMTKAQRKTYERHRELAKKEQEEHKNKNMPREIKVAFYRKRRREYKKFHAHNLCNALHAGEGIELRTTSSGTSPSVAAMRNLKRNMRVGLRNYNATMLKLLMESEKEQMEQATQTTQTTQTTQAN